MPAASRGGVITEVGPVMPGTEIVRGANARAARVGQPEPAARGMGLEVVGSAEGGADWAGDLSCAGCSEHPHDEAGHDRNGQDHCEQHALHRWPGRAKSTMLEPYDTDPDVPAWAPEIEGLPPA